MEELFFCDGVGGLRGRRQVLAAGLAAAGACLTSLSWGQTMFRTDLKDGPVLVVLFLRGGADGLNIVVPHGDDEYYKVRPTIAIRPPKSGKRVAGDALNLDGYFGLHPSLLGVYELSQQGKAQFVHAVGSGDATHSHFEAMGTMEQGLFDPNKGAKNGWIARYMGATPERMCPLRAVSFGMTMQESMSGMLGAVSLNSLAEYRLTNASPNAIQGLSQMYKDDNELGRSGTGALKIMRDLASADVRNYQPEPVAKYSESGLSSTLREIAYLVKRDIGLEVACVESYGWDTHVAQGADVGWQSLLLKDLDQSISAFFRDLGSLSDRVVLTVQTEFGRRVSENSGLGTDHGAGSMMMVLGGPQRATGVSGRWPGIRPVDLSGPGDLAVTSDYRNVLADVLSDHLQFKAANQVFPGLMRERIMSEPGEKSNSPSKLSQQSEQRSRPLL